MPEEAQTKAGRVWLMVLLIPVVILIVTLAPTSQVPLIVGLGLEVTAGATTVTKVEVSINQV